MEKKKILIIDDEKAFTRTVKLNLESLGKYTVRIENYGANGLDAAKEFKPDLILLDIMMPDMAGSDVGAKLKEDSFCKDIPLVFLTALVTNKETNATCSEISGYPFIAKPVNLKTLLGCIEKYLVKK